MPTERMGTFQKHAHVCKIIRYVSFFPIMFGLSLIICTEKKLRPSFIKTFSE